MYKIKKSGKFKTEYKKYKFDKNIQNELRKVLNILVLGEKLPEKYQDHSLKGKFIGTRECHIKPDVLLIYKIDNGELELLLLRLGSHSDLF